MTKNNLIQFYYNEHKTLQEIGNEYNISRERVRQIMERFNLPRHTKRGGIGVKPRFQSLIEYFKYIRNGGKESHFILLKFISPIKQQCEECASMKHLNIHHLKYPAESLDDIEILCASCHHAKHRKGNGVYIQLEMCNKYIKGKSAGQIAKEHRVNKNLIYHILHKWNIKRRTTSQAMRLYFHNTILH